MGKKLTLNFFLKHFFLGNDNLHITGKLLRCILKFIYLIFCQNYILKFLVLFNKNLNLGIFWKYLKIFIVWDTYDSYIIGKYLLFTLKL